MFVNKVPYRCPLIQLKAKEFVTKVWRKDFIATEGGVINEKKIKSIFINVCTVKIMSIFQPPEVGLKTSGQKCFPESHHIILPMMTNLPLLSNFA